MEWQSSALTFRERPNSFCHPHSMRVSALTFRGWNAKSPPSLSEGTGDPPNPRVLSRVSGYPAALDLGRVASDATSVTRRTQRAQYPRGTDASTDVELAIMVHKPISSRCVSFARNRRASAQRDIGYVFVYQFSGAHQLKLRVPRGAPRRTPRKTCRDADALAGSEVSGDRIVPRIGLEALILLLLDVLAFKFFIRPPMVLGARFVFAG